MMMQFGMESFMTAFISLIFILTLTVIGDYCIKSASQNDNGLQSSLFLFGAALYGLPAIGWYFLMRTNSLAALGVIYSSATVVTMALLGALVFKEALSIRDVSGIVLAIAAVIVIGGD